jgi:hypothetical protein
MKHIVAMLLSEYVKKSLAHTLFESHTSSLHHFVWTRECELVCCGLIALTAPACCASRRRAFLLCVWHLCMLKVESRFRSISGGWHAFTWLLRRLL